MLGDRRLQGRYRLAMLAQRQPGVGAVLHRLGPQRVEPSGERSDPVFPRQLRERRSGPRPEGLVEQLGGVSCVTLAERRLTGDHQILEAGRIDLCSLDHEAVAGRTGDQHAGRLAGWPVRFEHPPEIGDVGLQRGIGVRRRRLAPDQVSQPLRRDRTTQLDEQRGQNGALLPAAEIELAIAVGYPQSSQDSVLQAPFLPRRVARPCGRRESTRGARRVAHRSGAGAAP